MAIFWVLIHLSIASQLGQVCCVLSAIAHLVIFHAVSLVGYWMLNVVVGAGCQYAAVIVSTMVILCLAPFHLTIASQLSQVCSVV